MKVSLFPVIILCALQTACVIDNNPLLGAGTAVHPMIDHHPVTLMK